MEYVSDYLGRMERIIYPDGEDLRYGYDYGGNVVKVTGTRLGREFEYVKEIGYNEQGQRVYIKYGNGVETRYEYDAERRWLKGIETESAAGRRMQGIRYRFDAVGNVLGYENEAMSYRTAQSYRYDGLYQLVGAEGETEYKPHGTLEYRGTYSQEFSFDGIGNMRAKESRSGNSLRLDLGDELNYRLEYEYAEGYAHRAERIGGRYYRYDRNGNVVSEQDGAYSGEESAWDRGEVELEGGELYAVEYGWALANPDAAAGGRDATRREYGWNERNLLKASVDGRYRVEYRYGSDGERAVKWSAGSGGSESETLYFSKLWSWHIDSRMNSGAGRNSKQVYVGETRVAVKLAAADRELETSTNEEGEKQYWYHGDHLGSAQVISDVRGEEYERIEYTPYGEVWIERKGAVSNLDIPYRFTGKERDSETGLYYYGARYLDSKTGRWLSTDPALGEYVPEAPVNEEARRRNGNLPGMGGVYNLVNLHVYHYAGNNPVKYTDPDGRSPQAAVEAAQAAGPAAPVVLGVGLVIAVGTDPEARRGIANGLKAIWDGIGKLGSILMAASDKLKSTVAGSFSNTNPETGTSSPDPDDPEKKDWRREQQNSQQSYNRNDQRDIGRALKKIENETGAKIKLNNNQLENIRKSIHEAKGHINLPGSNQNLSMDDLVLAIKDALNIP
jgi:RHS repeat-associated protein